MYSTDQLVSSGYLFMASNKMGQGLRLSFLRLLLLLVAIGKMFATGGRTDGPGSGEGVLCGLWCGFLGKKEKVLGTADLRGRGVWCRVGFDPFCGVCVHIYRPLSKFIKQVRSISDSRLPACTKVGIQLS